MRLLVLAMAAAATLSIAGCGCGGDDDSDLPDAPEGPWGDLLDEMCGVLDRCPGGLGYPIAYRSRRECVAILDFAISCRLTEDEISDDVSVWGVEQNRPELDDEAVAACIEWLAEASCDEVARGGEGTPCALAFAGDDDDDDDDSGSRAVDEECGGDYDCRPELYCQPGGADPEAALVTCQVCKPRRGVGEECQQYGRQCAESLHCRYEEDGPRLCAPLDPDGTRCVESEQCASGFCNETLDELGGWGQCDPGGREGDACRDESETEGLGSDCRLELHCDGGTCQPRRENGATCSDGWECAAYLCEEGTCGRADGSACYDHPECASGLCIEEVCSPRQDGACVRDEQCEAPEICQGACRPPDCYCSGSGCPIGTCSTEGGGGGGGYCEDDSDCASGDCDDGACTTPRAIGDPCAESYECYPLGTCGNGVCVERFDPGEECGALDSCKEPFLCIDGRCELMNVVCEPAAAGELCAWLRVCDEDSWCDLFDGVTCKPRAGEGEECQTSFIPGIETCRTGLTCEGDESGTFRCRARPAIGDPCTTTCIEGAFCFEGTCQSGPIGQPCDEYDAPCPAGLFCDDRSEVCLPPGGQGAPCEESSHCTEEFFCESYRDCQPRRGVGESCNDTQECRHELHCSNDTYTCQADLSEGELCDARYAPCAEGLWCPNGGIDPSCTELTAAGEPCSSNEECESGACYSYSWCQAAPDCVIPD